MAIAAWKTLLAGKTVLVTGGTGSFGKKFVEIALTAPKLKKLIVFSRDELKQYEMRRTFSDPRMRYFLGDVRDRERLYRALAGVEIVVHAAALKQVDAAEYNPSEVVKTNIIGTQNVLEVSLDREVERVLSLSTDKAANPVNLYGATKLCADKLVIAANSYAGAARTKFSVVRYGNVMGSRGSVVDVFLKARASKRVPITDPRMTRFCLSITQGVSFVLQCLTLMQGGEIFIPKIPSIKLPDLARAVAPDCTFDIVGLRPGEKLHEVMVPEDESGNTLEYDNHYRILPVYHFWTEQEYQRDGGRAVQDRFRYSSDANTHWLTVEEIRQLLKE